VRFVRTGYHAVDRLAVIATLSGPLGQRFASLAKLLANLIRSESGFASHGLASSPCYRRFMSRGKYTPYRAHVKHKESIRVSDAPLRAQRRKEMTTKQSIRQKSDAPHRDEMNHPSLPGEVGCLADRLQIILKGRSSRSFARAAGVSETVFRKYMAGVSEPTRPALLAIASEAGVRVGWLAAGEEPMSASEMASNGGSQSARPDIGTLRSAAEVLERALADVDATTDAAGRAELLVAIYDLLEQGSALEAAQRVVATMLRAASRATGATLKQG
jgi:transcriptional regulator with XRE-family HTH domain